MKHINSFLLIIFLIHSLVGQVENWERKASIMVDSQIMARGVSDDHVLNIMRQTPRHEFIPVEQQPNAYMDYPLPIGYEQTISQPYIVGLMTSLLQL